jgi:hypothetical protein
MQILCKYYTSLCMGLKLPQILVSVECSGTNTPRILRNKCIHIHVYTLCTYNNIYTHIIHIWQVYMYECCMCMYLSYTS